jgi:hypothetical protein|eukprot:SAG25_NODE_327_length_9727_cov_5.510283_2_plen_101_part_00
MRGKRRHVIYVATPQGEWESYRVGLSHAIAVPIDQFVWEALLHFPASLREQAVSEMHYRGIRTVQDLVHDRSHARVESLADLLAMGFPDAIARSLCVPWS